MGSQGVQSEVSLQREENPQSMAAEQERLSDVALSLVRTTARFTRTVGRVPGVTYSAIAWRVLSDLTAQGPTRVSDLAKLHRVAQPTMTSLVHRLEGEAWVQRGPDPADGRATLVSITRAGEHALGNFRGAAAAKITPLLAELSARDRATLERASELMEQLSELA